MKAFETTATIDPMGELRLAGVPYSAGTQVDVIVSPKRKSGDEFRSQWEQVCQQLRSLPQVRNMSDEEIQSEVAAYRAGR